MIPARNEAATLAETLDALQRVPRLSSIIVVDDGSRDTTAAIARRLDAEVLSSASA